ncbi:PREDICTED: uncharacterized protein LOC109158735 [Ipomoea nil]|uniref:uncharacterized protein LOC109158735 n=1 Tax=Ipomoea nil TaxID=35883 RepID=UPI00090143EE|nr:PREDICTED: uncharacterized protein LOC109158735 [Ipomoea nil]
MFEGTTIKTSGKSGVWGKNQLRGDRPICLCTLISKVFTCVVASRLSQILSKLISREQAGFVEGRSIQDNVLLAFELLQQIHKECRGSNLIVKLDMMKAFDRVSWPFLRAVLSKLGFPATFVNIIMNNSGATRLSVLVNGVSCGFFQPTRGVKQGDPLSSPGRRLTLIRHVSTMIPLFTAASILLPRQTEKALESKEVLCGVSLCTPATKWAMFVWLPRSSGEECSSSMTLLKITCEMVQQVWHYFGGVLGLTSANTSSIRAECHAWWLLAAPGSAKDWFAKLVPCLILWFLWCSYNHGLFEDTPFSAFGTINKIKRELLLI